MGLIELGNHRIGFWMADRTSAAEIPAGLVPHIEGTPTPEGSTLVLVGADEGGVPVWSVLLHAPSGASLLLPWEDQLFVALGERAVLIDEHGTVHARRTFDDAPLSAWRVGSELLLLGSRGARLVDRNVSDLWAVPLQADGFHPLNLQGGHIRLAAMRAESWDEIVLDARTRTGGTMNVADNPSGSSRVIVDESGDSLRLTMPPQRGRWTTVLFLLFWLCLWSLGGLFGVSSVLEQIRAHTYGVEFLFLSFWCLGWFVAELAVLITVAWNIGGRESVILRGDSLIVRAAVGPLAWSRSFDVSAIHGLRITRRPFAYDNPANLLALESVLEPLGRPLVRATSGEEALKRLQEQDFALVLMDICMPVLSGFDTVEQIRALQKGRHLPVMFITAVFRDEASAQRGYNLGAIDFLIKPFEPATLRAKVKALAALYLNNKRADELERRIAEESHGRKLAEFANIVLGYEVRDSLCAILLKAQQHSRAPASEACCKAGKRLEHSVRRQLIRSV